MNYLPDTADLNISKGFAKAGASDSIVSSHASITLTPERELGGSRSLSPNFTDFTGAVGLIRLGQHHRHDRATPAHEHAHFIELRRLVCDRH